MQICINNLRSRISLAKATRKGLKREMIFRYRVDIDPRYPKQSEITRISPSLSRFVPPLSSDCIDATSDASELKPTSIGSIDRNPRENR